jgi:hypothetical protein
VRERGVFGAIFGTFISAGAYFAFEAGKYPAVQYSKSPEGKNIAVEALMCDDKSN